MNRVARWALDGYKMRNKADMGFALIEVISYWERRTLNHNHINRAFKQGI